MPATLAVSALTVNSSNVDATSYTTASVSPAQFSLVVVFVATGITSGNAPSATPSGLGLTWTQHATVGTVGSRMYLWSAPAGASPGSGAITLTMGDTGGGGTSIGTEWAVLQVTGADNASPFVQSNSANLTAVTSITITLATSSATANRAIAAFGVALNAENIVPRAGWTELGESSHISPLKTIEVQWRSDDFGSDDASASWTTSANCRGLAAEIRAYAGVTVNGTAIAALDFDATAVGKRTVKGAAVASLDTFSATALGKRTAHGAAVAPLDTFNATILGRRTVHGTALATLGPCSSTIVGKRTVKATAAATLGPLSSTIAGRRVVRAVALARLDTFAATAHAPAHVRGVALAVLDVFSAHARGLVVEVHVPPYGVRVLNRERSTLVTNANRATRLEDDAALATRT